MLNKMMRSYQLYLMLLLPVAYFIVFKYVPMLGIQIAFKKYMVLRGIWDSPWVGFKHFEKLFNSYQFTRIVRNTVTLSLYELAVAFPFPILLALAINSSNNKAYKKVIQLTTYAPHFISTVVIVGIIVQFLSLRLGLVNKMIEALGGEAIDFLGKAEYFQSIFVWSHVWQNAGWGTIIYLAVLASVDPQLYEASIIDGASKFKRILHIDIPAILPTVIILFILQVGSIMNVGFEKTLLLQTPLNLTSSEVLQTYVYKVGLASNMIDYSYATAIGLFTAVINFAMLLIVNHTAKRVAKTSLW
ncbi:ABC transporter permease [Paenibacillus koleovorans]|uniref:ABC transporter permease n=1 Tax=Paenibacillus koleovorans TaxID=121608 RepID=UPI001FE45D9E|nr:ABC transporter permease subunit [Paenibacillus koleovorans]